MDSIEELNTEIKINKNKITELESKINVLGLLPLILILKSNI